MSLQESDIFISSRFHRGFNAFMNSRPVGYIRNNPFSTMAISNIAGDLCFIGFAYEPDGTISAAKLAGAALTIPAHLLLLAYGDKDAEKIARENNVISEILLAVREVAKTITRPLSKMGLLEKPIAVSFGMLSLNGAGLVWDAIPKIYHHLDVSSASQTVSGIAIGLGCGAFAFADLAKTQKIADLLSTSARTILPISTAANIVMAYGTENKYMIGAAVAFVISNFSGFFTKFKKTDDQVEPLTPPGSAKPKPDELKP